MLVNARYAGVAQNRPRFIMLAIREDLINRLSPATAEWFQQGLDLIDAVRNNDTEYDSKRWGYCDLTTDEWRTQAKHTVFAPLVSFENSDQPTVYDAIRDLHDENPEDSSAYVAKINKQFSECLANPTRAMGNLQHPNSTPRVRARFRLYQIIAQSDRETANAIKNVMKGKSDTLPGEAVTTLLHSNLLPYDQPVPQSESDLMPYLAGLSTKKFSQRALLPNVPAPAALSIPDDVCHYTEARTLSVREMARIQSFPDAFEFRGIPTTGGLRRRYQVPQYTQIGNAVPPLLGHALGIVISDILTELTA